MFAKCPDKPEDSIAVELGEGGEEGRYRKMIAPETEKQQRHKMFDRQYKAHHISTPAS